MYILQKSQRGHNIGGPIFQFGQTKSYDLDLHLCAYLELFLLFALEIVVAYVDQDVLSDFDEFFHCFLGVLLLGEVHERT